MKSNLILRRRLLLAAFASTAVFTLTFGVSRAALYETPDVKVYAFIVKKKGLSDEEFHAHWREPHARLTLKVPQIRRYLQNHANGSVPRVPGLEPTPYFGIATIWVSTVDQLAQMPKDPGYAEVHADELNLLERDQLAWLISRETVVASGPSPSAAKTIPTKAILLLKKRAGVAAQVFNEGVAKVARSVPHLLSAGRVTYSLPADAAYKADIHPPFDAVIEIAFNDDAAFSAAWESKGAKVLQRLATVADIAVSRGFLAHEERVLWPPIAR